MPPFGSLSARYVKGSGRGWALAAALTSTTARALRFTPPAITVMILIINFRIDPCDARGAF
jgi:hypothetical protein